MAARRRTSRGGGVDRRAAGRLPHLCSRDRLYPLWQLIALRGQRRGEAAGLRWVDLDLDRRELTVSRQLVHSDGRLIACPPKSAASRRVIALDGETVRLLRRQEQAQRQQLGDAWLESGPIFAWVDGSPLRPDYLTVRFRKLVGHLTRSRRIGIHGARAEATYSDRAKGLKFRIFLATSPQPPKDHPSSRTREVSDAVLG
jgi:integrase